MALHLLPDCLYRIPDQNLGALTDKIDALIKRARKIGVPQPTMRVMATEEHRYLPYVDFRPANVPPGYVAVRCETQAEADGYAGRVDRTHIVAVAGESPRYDGWRMVAVIELDHEEPDAPNIVDVLPGEVLDLAWRDLSEQCDHCHVGSRGRKKLVVVEHTDGSRKIIGTTCLRDFLGHAAPGAIASWCELLFSFDPSEFEQYDEDRTPRSERRFDPEFFLGWVARSVRSRGWVSRGQARNSYDDITATADAAFNMMCLFTGDLPTDHRCPRPEPLTDEEIAEGAAAWAWGQAQEPTNDYLANVAAVAARSTLRYKHLGLAASFVSGLQREQSRMIERQAREAIGAGSVHFGSVKERLPITGTVTSVRYYESEWGPYAWVSILTDEGNIVEWKCTGRTPEQGTRVTGPATVKGHSEYRGELRTTVQRLTWKLIEEPALVPAATNDDEDLF